MTHKQRPSGWDDVATWYDGWVGKEGSSHHQNLAIPALLDLLPQIDKSHVLDIGCGSGVLAPYIAELGANYIGIDVSQRLINKAKQYHGKHGRFLVCDARNLRSHVAVSSQDVCVYLLSIQDMNPLDAVLENAAYVLREGGSVIILMTHPCFRIPRQSGWGYENKRKLQYRRIDRYLSPLKIPMKQHKRGTTISFHRPLSAYINTLGACGLMVDHLDEITTYQQGDTKAEKRANDEIPLFMTLRARKSGAG